MCRVIAIVPEAIELWMRAFSEAVRKRDFASGRELFDDRVMSFGTVCVRAETLDDLASRQWSVIWPNTRGFEFEYESSRALVGEGQATVMAHWSSAGLGAGGALFQRRGRATIVLAHDGLRWKAVHTHFSINPDSIDDSLLRQTA
jgi:ketosteroid isomerase-like protein